MREKQESGSVPVPAEFMSAQSAIVGLRGKDLLTTVRSLAVHGLRQPLHSARHLVAFGGQLGKVLLGDTLHQPNPQDARFQDPSCASIPSTGAPCRPTWRGRNNCSPGSTKATWTATIAPAPASSSPCSPTPWHPATA